MIKMKCSVCGKECILKHAKMKYCPDCRKKVLRQQNNKANRKYYANIKYEDIKKHRNDSSYSRNKTILFNYQWYAIVYNHRNNCYWVVKKTMAECSKDNDIWDTIEKASKRGRVSHFTKLEGAISDIYDCMLSGYANKVGYGADLFCLRNAIIDAKKELLKAISEHCPKRFGQIDAEAHESKNKGALNQ